MVTMKDPVASLVDPSPAGFLVDVRGRREATREPVIYLFDPST